MNNHEITQLVLEIVRPLLKDLLTHPKTKAVLSDWWHQIHQWGTRCKRPQKKRHNPG